MNTFITHYQIQPEQLERQLISLGIPLSLFDGVIWCYCEKCVKRTAALGDHFDKKFPPSDPVPT